MMYALSKQDIISLTGEHYAELDPLRSTALIRNPQPACNPRLLATATVFKWVPSSVKVLKNTTDILCSYGNVSCWLRHM